MEVFTSGPNTGNILVTLLLVTFLLIASSRAKMLDKSGSRAAALLGLVVGGLGHWTWLLILLGFLLSSHKATKWRFDEKKRIGAFGIQRRSPWLDKRGCQRRNSGFDMHLRIPFG